MKRVKPEYYKKSLSRYIKKIRPDIIHTMETQNAGYLVLEVKRRYFTNKKFPLWWHTNWGSDIYLFGRLKKHKERIKELLNEIDYYSCESKRDVELAKQFGFKKTVMPVYPNSGGLKLPIIMEMRSKNRKTSDRKLIMLKGYQGWAGRAFVGIRALTLAKEYLKDYKVVIYSCEGYSMEIAAELFAIETGIELEILPENTKHEDILRYHGLARISIGLSISDAISTSVLEAMAMGSFPIQSWTSTAGEWFEDGKSGLLVPPEDPEVVAEALKRALTDDELVDSAYEINWNTVKERLDYDLLKEKTINSYRNIMDNRF